MTDSIQIASLFHQLRNRERSRAPWMDGGPVAIYGAGSFGRSLCRTLLDQNIPVSCLVDRGALPGQAWQGIPVMHPDALPREQWASLTVLVGLHNPSAPVADIVSELCARGCSRVIDPISALGHLGPGFGHRYWLVAPDYYQNAEALVMAARDILEPESRPLFDSVLAQRLTGAYGLLPRPTHGIDDYAPAEILDLQSPIRLVDGGAYDGDTIRALQKSGRRLQAVAAFEPDPSNFSKLASWAGGHPNLAASLWPCGLYSHTTQLQFLAGEGESSAIAIDGATTIQCVALDDAAPNFRPTFLKLDVEGAEPAALIGARRTIQEHRPFISAGLYHHPAHLWQVPLLVKHLHPGYRLQLRLHAANGFELRLYAVPGAGIA